MEILVVSKQTAPNIRKAVHIATRLKAVLDAETARKIGEKGVDIEDFRGDFVITIGGDGTFLWTVSKTSLPIMAVRTEGVGFLCTADYEEVVNAMMKVKRGQFFETRIPTLRLSRDGETVAERAVNEVVVTRPLKSKILRAHVTIGQDTFYYKGDGFLVSTSRGSTAYNLSLRGPVIADDREVVFTPIAPITNVSSLVFRPPLEFRVERSNEVAILDGNRTVEIEKDRDYEIAFGRKVTLLSLKPLNHFSKYIQSLAGR